ncbi:DUF86 domain-containing protein [Leptolyngbyaceae cyanobacterium UHCC 1019]
MMTHGRHMRDAAKDALSFIQNKTRNALDTDRMLTLSLVKCIEIIGEAASRITKERQAELPKIFWSKIIGMRNRLIHAYFDIELDIVWDTVTQALPPLLDQLEIIIGREE